MSFIVIFFILGIAVLIVIAVIYYICKDFSQPQDTAEKPGLEKLIQLELEKNENVQVFMYNNYAVLLEFAQDVNNIDRLLNVGSLNNDALLNANLYYDYVKNVYDKSDYETFKDLTFENALPQINKIFSANLIQFFATSFIQKTKHLGVDISQKLEDCCLDFKTMLQNNKISEKSKAEFFYYWYDNTCSFKNILSAYAEFVTAYKNICSDYAINTIDQIQIQTNVEPANITETHKLITPKKIQR